MTTCVYYDQETISPHDIRCAVEQAGPGALHFRPADAVWPNDVRATASDVWSYRDYTFWEPAMQKLDRVIQHGVNVQWRGVSLLEVIRYDWFFAMQKAFHRAWVLAELLSKQQPTAIHWVTTTPTRLDEIGATCGQAGVRFSRNITAAGILQYHLRQGARRLKLLLWMRRDHWRRQRLVRQKAGIAMKTRTPDKQPPILFTEFYPNSAKLALYVAGIIDQQSDCNSLFIAGRKEVFDLVTASGRPCRMIDEFANAAPADNPPVRRQLRNSLEQVLRDLPDDIFQPSPGAPCFRKYLQPILLQTGLACLYRATQMLKSARSMIESLSPIGLVTTTYSSSFGRALALMAESAGVPTTYIQHGVIRGSPFFSHFPNRRILVWGDSDRRALVESGVSPERIKVIGSPLYDGMTDQKPTSQPTSKRHRSFQALFLASKAGGAVVSVAMFELALVSVARSVLSLPDARLTVKLHPSEHTDIAHRRLGSSERVTVQREGDSNQLIRECDLAIVMSSTTGLAACILDKPLVVYNPTGIPDFINYRDYGAALCVTTEEELLRAIQQIQSDDSLAPGRRRLVDDMLDGAAGQAGNKAAHAIMDLLELNFGTTEVG